ncbi:MAG: ribosome small subunit-dependent GTPase A [Candidatus Solincola sediminis]|uniref:Small ribosomal subunit biogenesis GTPase RsgA n=1 Tax=Candidatus Solincola sediminis TaxID=1797199 RepID=A0A1F2WIY1_9ACTN|nr:MAG: ribosome small subunit-dependent GTPase A [Candidatus Solincola sediminis]OFW56810.1 MAG: ribosome small subunit-dependent GTPase A [Candidatus Solincola sediminis]
MRLEDLGYSDFFEAARIGLGLKDYSPARVIAEYKGSYRLRDGAREFSGTITGRQMFDARSIEDYPAVGDWAVVRETGEKAVIHQVLPRKTVLKRRYGGRAESQVIASNVDVAFVIESIDRDYNLNRFERYLTIVGDGGIKPVIVLNKADLISEQELNDRISQVEKRFGDINAVKTSTIVEHGLDEMRACILRGRTYCLLGSSGVGKSSIINTLLGKRVIRTDAISNHTGKGKHTTTAREMYFLENGGILIDTPGMREIGMTDSSAGLEKMFAEITGLARHCRFIDCTHAHEPGCAVRKAVESGGLDENRYANYLKLVKEAEYYEMSVVQKRRKDREFGRFMKKAKDQRKRQGP